MAKKKVGLGYKFLFLVLPPIWAVAITLIRLTYRVHPIDRERYREARGRMKEGGVVLAVWHQRLFPFLRMIRKTRATILVSLSPDGELIARTLRLLGHGTVRGSSTRRASGGLRDMVEAVRGGQAACYMADGPKGPLRKAKQGAIVTARDAGTGMVIPTASAAWPVVTLKSWDRFQIPLPFAKIVFAVGDPIPVPADAGREQIETARAQLEAALDELTDACDRTLGRTPAEAAA